MGAGYTGKVLVVDLTRREARTLHLGDDVYRNYLGGYGLGARILFDLIPKGADPLGPDNVLGLTPGLLTGTPALFSGRYMAVGKSPLTGGWGDANGGGTFGPAIKRAGWDGLFFKGQADGPVYVWIRDEKVEIRDARALRGKSVKETEAALAEEIPERNIHVACIGPSGEKLSLISGIFNDGGRCAARSGLGAVMGSKRLKAVAVKGSTKVEVRDPEALKAANQALLALLNTSAQAKMFDKLPGLGGVARFLGRFFGKARFHTKTMPPLLKTLLEQYGTPGFLGFYCATGEAPVRNWGGVAGECFPPDKAARISDDAVVGLEVKKYHCANCPVGCGGIIKVEEGPWPIEDSHKPEYETLAAFGSMCLVDDLRAICQANHLCNMAGMDTISAGSAIAFAMECYEHGILTRDDTDGIDLAWGDAGAMIALLEKMIAREGLGDVLADGVKRAAERIGKGSARYAMHSGGQEVGYHDPRIDPGFATAYQCEPTPGRHTIASYSYQELLDLHKIFPGERVKAVPQVIRKGWSHKPEGKARLQALNSKYIQLVNSAGLCEFGCLMGGPKFPIFRWINAATGWNLPNESYLVIGERIETLRQAFNAREGVRPFRMSDRLKGEPSLAAGPLRGITLNMGDLAREFYEELQWDPETAVPRKEALERLGLADVAKAL
jgi:aldehyde:ferredoxin oxidoreductase